MLCDSRPMIKCGMNLSPVKVIKMDMLEYYEEMIGPWLFINHQQECHPTLFMNFFHEFLNICTKSRRLCNFLLWLENFSLIITVINNLNPIDRNHNVFMTIIKAGHSFGIPHYIIYKRTPQRCFSNHLPFTNIGDILLRVELYKL